MLFSINLFLLLAAFSLVHSLISLQDNSSTSNTTVPDPKPSPPIVPLPPLDPVLPPVDPVPPSPTPVKPEPTPVKPEPKPKPAPPVVVISKDHVSEAKVPTAYLTEYQRFGHSVASFGSSVVVGTSKESLSSAVFRYTVEVSSSDDLQDGEDLNVTCSTPESVSAPSGVSGSYYDGFGLSVALSAQALAVAAPFHSTELAAVSSSGFATGAVFVYPTDSSEVQRLVPSIPNANMQFGASLALSDGTLVVGAPGANSMGQMSGAVYVYSYDNETSTWEEAEVLLDTSGGAAFAQFGSSVFLSDNADMLVVGASGYSKHAVHGGAVFLYQRSAIPLADTNDSASATVSVYTLNNILVPSQPHGYAYFGHTVHFRGPVGLVSAYDENGSGVVYLYELLQQKPSGDATDFKQAVAYLCKGCFLRRMSELSTQATWTLREVLRPLVSTPINQFGASLAIFHTSDANYAASPFLAHAYVVAVGAPGDVTTTTSTTSSAAGAHASEAPVLASKMFAGSVYLYLGPHNFTSAATNNLVSSDKWAYVTKILANDSSAYDAYGRSLSLMGAHLLVGAELANSEGQQRTGAVYLETNLIPYLVAAAQVREEEEHNTSGGGGESGTSAWAVFMAFFSTSGGIVTMSFLPIAVLLVVFVAHSQTKGKPVLSSMYGCKARLLGAGTHLPLATVEKSQHGASSEQQELSEDSAHLSTVYDHTSAQEAALSPTRADDTATATAMDSTPTLLKRLQHFLRNPLRTSTHVPLTAAAEVDTHPHTSTASTQSHTTSVQPPQMDLRLTPPVVGRTSEDAVQAGLSIRSPITHIPLHSHLVSSPHSRNPSPSRPPRGSSAVKSFRVEHDAVSGEKSGRESEEREENATVLAVTPSELAKLKQQLNAEFESPTGNNNLQSRARTLSSDGLLMHGNKKHVKLGDTHTLRV